MARILLDTGDLNHTADTLLSVDREIAGTLARLPADGATVMPPAIAAEVAGAVSDAMGNLGRVAERFFVNAADLRRRSLAAELGEGGSAARLGTARLMTRFGSAFRIHGVRGPWADALRAAGGPARGAWGSGTLHALTSGPSWGSKAFSMVVDGLGDTHDYFDTLHQFLPRVSGRWLGRLAHVPGVPKSFAWIESNANSPLFKYGGDVLAVVGGALNAKEAWDGSKGETILGRAFTTVASVESDMAMLSPVLMGANFISVGALRADMAAIGGIEGGAISGGQLGLQQAAKIYHSELESGDYADFARHVAGGTVSGAVHGANVALNVWDDQVANGDWGWPVQKISQGENWLIDKAYEPVTHVATEVTGAIGSGVGAGVHAAQSGAKAVSGGVHKLLGML